MAERNEMMQQNQKQNIEQKILLYRYGRTGGNAP